MELKSGVYNVAVYWPVELDSRIIAIKSKPHLLFPTQHYKHKAAMLRLPDNCYKVALYGQVVEAEYDIVNGVTKIITRILNRYNRKQDLCCAIAIDNDGMYIKTVWLNNKGDKHYTLNQKKYIQNA